MAKFRISCDCSRHPSLCSTRQSISTKARCFSKLCNSKIHTDIVTHIFVNGFLTIPSWLLQPAGLIAGLEATNKTWLLLFFCIFEQSIIEAAYAFIRLGGGGYQTGYSWLQSLPLSSPSCHDARYLNHKSLSVTAEWKKKTKQNSDSHDSKIDERRSPLAAEWVSTLNMDVAFTAAQCDALLVLKGSLHTLMPFT